jgi:predicted phage terminase large subunit-like protein
MGSPVSPQIAAAELLRRRRARESLIHYAQAIDIPGAPVSEDEDEWLFHPVESGVARHHVVMMDAIQRTMETPMGRLMILAPPGSAKSTYASVVGLSWAMGRWPGHRYILASYASTIARKQSRRCMQICKSGKYASIWSSRPLVARSAADDWSLTTGAEYMAAGILAGITGNRANGIIIDDPIAGREEADSETIREKTDEAYRDDVRSRLLPGGWIILINTRWHEDDLSGRILPDDYDGRTGLVRCKDGMSWEVLNIPAKAERADDPVGRRIGEYLWPQWFPPEHWQMVENDPRSQRTWSALYQQRPTGEGIGDFKRDMFQWYDEDELPERMEYYLASDYAVGEDDRNDNTDHGIFGMDEKGDLWAVDWWHGQEATDVTIDAALDLVDQWRPMTWWHEGGVIDKAITPAVNRRMQERRVYAARQALTHMSDKRAKCQSFRARASAGTIHLPRGKAWASRLVDQLIGYPAVRFDDAYDVCGLIGRGIDQMMEARPKDPPKPRGIKPFTEEWLMHDSTKRKRR